MVAILVPVNLLVAQMKSRQVVAKHVLVQHCTHVKPSLAPSSLASIAANRLEMDGLALHVPVKMPIVLHIQVGTVIMKCLLVRILVNDGVIVVA